MTKTLAGEVIDLHALTKHNKNKDLNNVSTAITDDFDPENPPWKDLKDEDLLLASPLVYGFSLTDKLWSEILILALLALDFNMLRSGVLGGRRAIVYLE